MTALLDSDLFAYLGLVVFLGIAIAGLILSREG